MMCANNRVHCGSLVAFVCLHTTLPHYHRHVDISEGIELQKCLQLYSVECVSNYLNYLSSNIRDSVFSSDPYFYDYCEKTYALFYYRHQLGSFSHLPLLMLGHETMVRAVCLSISLLLRLIGPHILNYILILLIKYLCENIHCCELTIFLSVCNCVMVSLGDHIARRKSISLCLLRNLARNLQLVAVPAQYRTVVISRDESTQSLVSKDNVCVML